METKAEGPTDSHSKAQSGDQSALQTSEGTGEGRPGKRGPSLTASCSTTLLPLPTDTEVFKISFLLTNDHICFSFPVLLILLKVYFFGMNIFFTLDLFSMRKMQED
ncbi:hypothetical protein XENOCAPTIV_003156 [Xenoophorus captivus]|uniref:Uncharacterized protein n=1 Tax=Xenoophorus captivus TaxID=1517983 RepID=A0ABV0R2Z3_9TELE